MKPQGDYESIKACQKIIFDKESIHSKLESAKEALNKIEDWANLRSEAYVEDIAKDTLIKLGG